MSPRRNVLKVASMLAALALIGALFAGSASAKKMSAKQKAQVRASLKKQIKKNPKAIQKKSFLKKASLVNFKLPITVQLRGATAGPGSTAATTNPNSASIDLGPSLGQREINLGGKLAGEITFKDSYDGGALGNVDLSLNPGPKGLTSTSIPLLWNSQVSDGSSSWDNSFLGSPAVGCADFTGNSPLPFGPLPSPPFPAGTNLPGVPAYANGAAALAGNPTVAGTTYIDEIPGVDDINNLSASKIPGDNNALGGTTDPFPVVDPNSEPGSFPNPSVKDTVLRTNALNLTIATPGTETVTTSGVQGSQNVVIGKSGGQANLFGNIPGKNTGIDVTVSLATEISSILRSVDPDRQALIQGAPWPAASFVCRQAWTGKVQNYIPGVRLTGNLKISPAITPSGKLRIAKATLASPAGESTRIGLAACLSPYSVFAAENNSSDTVANTVPMGPATTPRPIDELNPRSQPNVVCDAPPTQLVQSAGFGGLANAALANGYSTTNDGSKVSVSGDLKVNGVSADVLIGDV